MTRPLPLAHASLLFLGLLGRSAYLTAAPERAAGGPAQASRGGKTWELAQKKKKKKPENQGAFGVPKGVQGMKGQGAGQGRGAGGKDAAPGGKKGSERQAILPSEFPGPDEPPRAPLPEPFGVDRGVYPTLFPSAVDALLVAGPVHQDVSGGADQRLLALSASPSGGFAGVFQDGRKGNLGLFLARIDAAGEPVWEQAPLSEQVGTARELDPAVAALGDGAGAFTWMKMSGRSQAYLRFFEPERAAWSGMFPLGSVDYRERLAAALADSPGVRDGRGRQAVEAIGAPSHATAAAVGDRVVVVWREAGSVVLQSFAEGQGERLPAFLNEDEEPATGALWLSPTPEGALLVAWDTYEGIALARVDLPGLGQAGPIERPRLGPGGNGSLVRLIADPRKGSAGAGRGFWMLVAVPPGLVLRHVGPDGGVDGGDQPVALDPIAGADLASWSAGLVLLQERAGAPEAEGLERRIELHFLRSDGTPTSLEPIALAASARAEGAFLAGEGVAPTRLLVAYNDEAEADADVYYALLEPAEDGPRLGAPRRWNDDAASSYQDHGAVAANASRALITWVDERASAGRIAFRVLGADGAWLGAERFAAAAALGEASRMQRPEAALDADGRALIAWCESATGSPPFALRAQVFDAAGEPASPAFDVDAGFAVASNSAPACAALEDGQGFLIAWSRADEGPRARRISPSGGLLGDVEALSSRTIPTAANLALERLEPRRLVCAWDEAFGQATRVLAGRLLGPDAAPLGEELQFDWSGSGGDIDPELVATGDGGFAMAWTGRDGPPRDVFARFFGPEGEPAGPPLAISTIQNEQDFADVARLADGSLVVVWEDDLTGVDRIVGRRVGLDRRTLGDAVLLDPGGGKDIEVRRAPRCFSFASLGAEGSAKPAFAFGALWADHSQSLGVDVFLQLFGPGFDLDRPEKLEGPDAEAALWPPAELPGNPAGSAEPAGG